jgi:response regulator of citrate/malate metabolism
VSEGFRQDGGPAADGPEIRVLVVDDDLRVARINAAYVDRVDGFRVTARAHSAAEALTRADDSPVDLILMDHYLPDGDGLSVVRELRRLGNRTDVIMVTAARDVATVQAAMRHGALEYLVKPFSFAGLRAKLETYAELRRTAGGDPDAVRAEADRVLGERSAGVIAPDLPRDAADAELVRETLRTADAALSSTEIAERSGVPLETVRSCLRQLERCGRVHPVLRYDETGRPQQLHRWTPGP